MKEFSHQFSYGLLARLWDNKDWQRLEQQSLELLSAFPDDFYGNQAWAASLHGQNKYTQMATPVLKLLQCAPNDPASHSMAVRYWAEMNKTKYAYWHCRKMLELEPAGAEGFFLTGWILYRMNKVGLGLRMMAEAIRLDPENISYAETEISIRSEQRNTIDDRLNQEADLKQILARNPSSTTAHKLLGYCLADRLDDPKTAIKHYRIALTENPSDIECQQNLVSLIPVQNIFTRTLFLPIIGCKLFCKFLASGPWAWIYVLVFHNVVALFLMWLIPMILLFGIPAKIYEAFFLADTALISFKSPVVRRIMILANRVPFWVRILSTILLWMAFWTAVLGSFGMTFVQSIVTIASIFGVHLGIVVVSAGIRKLKRTLAKRHRLVTKRGSTRRLLGAYFAVNIVYLSVLIPVSVYSASFETGVEYAVPLMLIDMIFLVHFLLVSGRRISEWRARRREVKQNLPDAGKPPPLPDVRVLT